MSRLRRAASERLERAADALAVRDDPAERSREAAVRHLDRSHLGTLEQRAQLFELGRRGQPGEELLALPGAGLCVGGEFDLPQEDALGARTRDARMLPVGSGAEEAGLEQELAGRRGSAHADLRAVALLHA